MRLLAIITTATALLAQPIPLDAEERPNILFAIADDWSYGHAGTYGCDWIKTPNFDRIAAEGILFNRAYTPNAKCAPSRAIVLTGRYSWQLEEAGNHMALFPSKFGSYVERLAEEGYATGYTGKGWAPGIANDADGKRRNITGKAFRRLTLEPLTEGISQVDYAANFSKFLDESPSGEPWAFWYGSLEPHRGYEEGSGTRLGKSVSDIDRVPSYWPDNETIRNDMLDYSIEVEHFDNHLGKMIATLEGLGQLDNTLIVVTSDHGMPFPRVKGQAYEHSNHIPLAIRWPEGIKGTARVIEDYVNFADLAPTFLEVAGVSNPGPLMQPMTGRSLTDIFASDRSGQLDPTRDHVLIGKERHDIGRPNNWGYPIRGIIKADKLYLKNFETDRWPAGNPETGYLNCDAGLTKTEILELRRSGTNETFWQLNFGKRPDEEFYDLSEDPDCVNNEISSGLFIETIDAMKKQLFEELDQQGDPRMNGEGDQFDNYPYSAPSTDNFYERFMDGEKLEPSWVRPTDFESRPIE